MLYLFIGDDDFSRTEVLAEMKRQLGDAETQKMSLTVLDGKTVTADELRNACETMPFFVSKRLVVVDGLLEQFEPSKRESRSRNEDNDDKASVAQENRHKPFVAALSSMPPTTDVVVSNVKPSAGNRLYKDISPLGKVKEFNPLKNELPNWVKERVAKAGGSVSPKAAVMLARQVGNDLWTMSNEIEKLLVFTGGRRIEEADINEMVSYTPEHSIFVLVDAVIDLRAEMAGRALQSLLDGGAAPQYLLTMLARQVQLDLRAWELKRQKKPTAEIQKSLGIAGFALTHTLEQADRCSPKRLRDVYHSILETDIAIKTGKYDPELALTALVIEVCQRDTSRIVRTVSRSLVAGR